MYADVDARGGILEPPGIVEVKYRAHQQASMTTFIALDRWCQSETEGWEWTQNINKKSIIIHVIYDVKCIYLWKTFALKLVITKVSLANTWNKSPTRISFHHHRWKLCIALMRSWWSWMHTLNLLREKRSRWLRRKSRSLNGIPGYPTVVGQCCSRNHRTGQESLQFWAIDQEGNFEVIYCFLLSGMNQETYKKRLR